MTEKSRQGKWVWVWGSGKFKLTEFKLQRFFLLYNQSHSSKLRSHCNPAELKNAAQDHGTWTCHVEQLKKWTQPNPNNLKCSFKISPTPNPTVFINATSRTLLKNMVQVRSKRTMHVRMQQIFFCTRNKQEKPQTFQDFWLCCYKIHCTVSQNCLPDWTPGYAKIPRSSKDVERLGKAVIIDEASVDCKCAHQQNYVTAIKHGLKHLVGAKHKQLR